MSPIASNYANRAALATSRTSRKVKRSRSERCLPAVIPPGVVATSAGSRRHIADVSPRRTPRPAALSSFPRQTLSVLDVAHFTNRYNSHGSHHAAWRTPLARLLHLLSVGYVVPFFAQSHHARSALRDSRVPWVGSTSLARPVRLAPRWPSGVPCQSQGESGAGRFRRLVVLAVCSRKQRLRMNWPRSTAGRAS